LLEIHFHSGHIATLSKTTMVFLCLGEFASKICGDVGLSRTRSLSSKSRSSASNVTRTPEITGSTSPRSPSAASDAVVKVKAPRRTDPIVLDTLQGAWFSSSGSKIHVSGTEVTLNGHVMKMHPVTLNEDGTVKSIGSIWQLWGWGPDDKIEFKESSSFETAAYGRSVYWGKMDSEESKREWTKHMTNLGYAGSALGDLNKRGVEGCRPGSCDAYKAPEDPAEESVHVLSDAIKKWRIPGLHLIKPASAIPDFSNRCHTGISVEHMHYLAKSFMEKGFQKRCNDTHKGHDMPVVVLEEPTTEWGKKSIENWRNKIQEDDGFPPLAHYEKTFQSTNIYTTLGNGHFFQALNLVGNECYTINDSQKTRYQIGSDALLDEAINVGVPSIVLRTDTPMDVRETISRLLNSKREYRWIMSRRGSLLKVEEDTAQVSQFVAMSKVLDAVELDCLVRVELGISDSDRIGK